MISFIFLQTNLVIAPYCTPSLNQCQTVSLTAQFFALFVGIMIHLTANSEQETIDTGSDKSMGTEKSVINTVILMANISVVLFPLSLLFDKEGMNSIYWRIHEKIDRISCWIMGKFKRKKSSSDVNCQQEALFWESLLQCSVVKADPCSRSELQLRGDFVQIEPHAKY